MRYFTVFFLFIFHFASAFTPDEDGMYAVFDTTAGEFTAELEYNLAPLTVGNFVGLAEGTIPWIDPITGDIKSAPFYDGIIFHRVIAGFVIQGGDPLGTGVGGPGYIIADEMSLNLNHSSKGVLSMANSGPNSGGSQFFIMLDDSVGTQSGLDMKHSVFGKVIDGEAVYTAIGAVEIDASERPIEDVVINSITILRVGEEARAFNTAGFNLPSKTPIDSVIEITENDTQSLTFTLDEENFYFVRTSTNLENWAEEIITHESGDPSEREMDLTADFETAGSVFAEVLKLVPTRPTTTLIPGSKFTATLSSPLLDAPWVYDFKDAYEIQNPNTTDTRIVYGEVTGASGASGVIYGYLYSELPLGAQIRVITSNRHIITFYLYFVDDTTGGFFARVEDYRQDQNPATPDLDPLVYPDTGTFELLPPEDD